MNNEVCAFAAGFSEGELCIGLHKNGLHFRPYAGISQKFDPPLLYMNRYWPGKIRWAEAAGCYMWELTSRNSVCGFLTDIEPYLICKKAQANYLIRYLRGELTAHYTRNQLLRCKQEGI